MRLGGDGVLRLEASPVFFNGLLSLLTDLAYGELDVKAALSAGGCEGRIGKKRLYIFAAYVDYPIAKQPSGHAKGGVGVVRPRSRCKMQLIGQLLREEVLLWGAVSPERDLENNKCPNRPGRSAGKLRPHRGGG